MRHFPLASAYLASLASPRTELLVGYWIERVIAARISRSITRAALELAGVATREAA